MRRRSKDQWQALLLEHKQSGKSASQFCREREINPKYFSAIKSKLQARRDNTTKANQTPERFQRLNVLRATTSYILLELKPLTLSLPTTVEPKWLAALIDELTV